MVMYYVHKKRVREREEERGGGCPMVEMDVEWINASVNPLI